MAVGTATVDFGAFPGTDKASIAVTGQAALVSGSKIEAWLRAEATAEHPEDEVMMLSKFVTVNVPITLVVAATGFTIVVVCHDGFSTGTLLIDWAWV